MQYVYLASFIETLQRIIAFVMENVFAPILTAVLQVFVTYVGEVLWVIWSELFLVLLVGLASMIDFIEEIFDIFAGLSPVTHVASNQSGSLLNIFLRMNAVSRALVIITFVAVCLCLVLTGIQTAKSIGDMALENKNPISHILTNAMKAGLTFLMIPLLCLSMTELTGVITAQMQAAFRAEMGGTDTSLGCVLFLVASLDADKQTMEAFSPFESAADNMKDKKRNPHLNDSIRGPFMRGEKDYRDVNEVKKVFHASNINYFVGFASCIMMLFILLGSILMFVRRIFEILLLYLASPFYAAAIPLDDGAMFAKWRELFVAKFLSGFGIIFTMKYYMMLVPAIAGGGFELYPQSTEINNILKIILIIGGAWAVYKGQHLLLQILSPAAAASAMESGAMVTGMIVGAASAAAGLATGGAASAGSLLKGAAGSGLSAASSGASQEKDDDQAFRGKT